MATQPPTGGSEAPSPAGALPPGHPPLGDPAKAQPVPAQPKKP
jgi:hypothetical protein